MLRAIKLYIIAGLISSVAAGVLLALAAFVFIDHEALRQMVVFASQKL